MVAICLDPEGFDQGRCRLMICLPIVAVVVSKDLSSE